MDVLTSETCSALNKVIIKQVASSWSLFTQLVEEVKISVTGLYIYIYIYTWVQPAVYLCLLIPIQTFRRKIGMGYICSIFRVCNMSCQFHLDGNYNLHIFCLRNFLYYPVWFKATNFLFSFWKQNTVLDMLSCRYYVVKSVTAGHHL